MIGMEWAHMKLITLVALREKGWVTREQDWEGDFWLLHLFNFKPCEYITYSKISNRHKECTLYDSTYLKFEGKSSLWFKKVVTGCFWLGIDWERAWENFLGDKNSLYLDRGVSGIGVFILLQKCTVNISINVNFT